MKDRKLVLIISVIVGFDVILFTAFTIVDPISSETVDTTKLFLDHGNTVLQTQVYMCKSSMKVYFDAIVFTSKGLMLLFGTFLAWETRKVAIPALNDSHHIGVCIYNVVVLSIMGVILAYVLVLHVTLHYVITSILLILGTTMTQSIIFVPKILKLKEQGLHLEDDYSAEGNAKNTIADPKVAPGQMNDDLATSMSHLPNPEVEQLEKDLEKARREIEQLRTQLKEKEEALRCLQNSA